MEPKVQKESEHTTEVKSNLTPSTSVWFNGGIVVALSHMLGEGRYQGW